MFEREKMRIRRKRRNNAVVILVSLVAIVLFWSAGDRDQLKLSRAGLAGNNIQSATLASSTEVLSEPANPITEFDPTPTIEHFQRSDQAISKRKIEVQEWKTPSGAKVLFMPTTGLPIVDIRVIFDAGSAREDDASSGVAGFVASLLDKGTKNFSETEIAKRFEINGAIFSSSSHRDMAVVHIRSLSEPKYFSSSIDLFLEVLAKPDFPIKEMERLRSLTKTSLIKKKELPGAELEELFTKALYKDHPYGRILEVKDVEAITRDKVQAFYQTFYTAQNVSVAIVGDITRKEAEKLVDRMIGMLPSGNKPGPLPEPPVLEKSVIIEHQFPSTQAHVKIGRLLIDRRDPDFELLYMANQILGGSGFSSILNEKVRQERGLAYSVSSDFSGMNSKGPFYIGFQTKASEYKSAVELANEILVKMSVDGVDQDRFDRIKKYVVSSFPLTTASNGSIVGYLGLMAFYDLPANYLDIFLEKLDSLDLSSVNQAAKKYWKDAPMVTVIVGDISAAKLSENQE